MFEKEAKKHKEEFITLYINVGGGLKAADMIGIQKEQSYKEGAELGYNKANEWHYVKDGDLHRQYEHTCFSIDVLANNKKWVYYEFSSGKWFCGNKEVNVIAWKEIIFPKEISK